MLPPSGLGCAGSNTGAGIDGIDNNGDGLVDLADSAEVTLIDSTAPLPIWNRLDQAYIRRQYYFYYVKDLGLQGHP